MACRVNNNITSSKRTTSSHLSFTKSSGGGAVIAGGRTSPNVYANGSKDNLHQVNSQQNNNKSASSHVNQAHLLNSFRTGNCKSKSTENISSNHRITTTTTTTTGTNIQSESVNSFEETMAGDIRIVDGKKPRKLWTLRDRSAMSVHLLKANLAEDGCEEAQLDVAKKLLQDSTDPTLLDTSQTYNLSEENSRLAIYWLIKSSEQGNDEATRLLKECLSAGRGITGQNILDVKTCISTPANEKLTFKAARLLYLKLNNGEEFITTTQLLARIHEVKKRVSPESGEGEYAKTSSDNSSNESPSDEEIISGSGIGSIIHGEDPLEFENARLNETFIYPHGRVSCDGVNGNNMESHAVQDDFTDDGNLQKKNSLFHETLLMQEGVKLTLEDLLKTAGSFNSGSPPRPTIDSRKKEQGRHNWPFLCQVNAFVGQLLILAALSGVMSLNHCCLLGSAFLSTWASYNVLIWRRRHSNFKDWAEAFKSVLGKDSWSEEKAENKFTWKLLLPFILALFVSLIMITLCKGLNPLKMVTGSLVIFSLFRGAMKSQIPSWRVITTLCIASLPNIIWHILNSIDKLMESTLTEQMTESVDNCFKLFDGYFVPVEKYTILLTLQLIILTSLLWTKRNTLLQETIPEVLFALWFLEVSQISVELTTFTFCFCIGSCTLIVFAFVAFESNMKLWKVILCTVALLLIISGGLVTMHYAAGGGTYLQNMPLFQAQGSQTEQPLDYNTIHHLNWDEYDTNCHRKAWKVVSPAETQVKCFLKYGEMGPIAVRWKGRIAVVKVKEIQQLKEQTALENILFDINVSILASEGSEGATSWQNFLPGSETGPSTPASILVSTKYLLSPQDKQNLIEFMFNLRTGDRIEFHGVLSPNSIGSLKPEIINVQSLKCLHCAIAENYVEYDLSSVATVEKSSTLRSFAIGESDSDNSNYVKLLQSYWQSVRSQVNKYYGKFMA